MADNGRKTGDELEHGAKKAAQTAHKAKKSVKTVQKAAAKAASGNYAGAAIDVLKDEGTRKVIALLLSLAILIPICLFFLAPLALYEGIMAAKAWLDEAGERFDEAYYSGTSGRFASFFKGLWAIIAGDDDEQNTAYEIVSAMQDETAGHEDNPTEDDLQVMGPKSSYSRVYERKLTAIQEKVNARQEEILDELDNLKTLNMEFEDIFDREVVPQYANRSSVSDVIFDGVTIEVNTIPLSKRGAAYLLTLYSSQFGEAPDQIKTSHLLQWLGYNAGNKHKLTFYLGENRRVKRTISAWKGTFLPQYLIDEAKAIGDETFGEYMEEYGCSVVDYLIVVNCPNFEDVEPSITKIPVVTEREVSERRIIHIPRYSDPEWLQPEYNSDGTVVEESVVWPYVAKYGTFTLQVEYPDRTDLLMNKFVTETKTGWYAERVSDFDVIPVVRIDDLLFEETNTRVIQEEKEEIHVSYSVYATISIRPPKDVAEIVGMWEGNLPWEEGLDNAA